MRNNQFTNIVAILVILMAFWTVSADAAPPAPPAPDKDRAHLAGISGDSGTWRRDPFGTEAKNGPLPANRIPARLKIAATGTGRPELNIQGIMQTDKKAFHALINGRVVKTGDKLEGLTIREISRYRVVFRNNNKENSIYDIYQGRIDRGKQ